MLPVNFTMFKNDSYASRDFLESRSSPSCCQSASVASPHPATDQTFEP